MTETQDNVIKDLLPQYYRSESGMPGRCLLRGSTLYGTGILPQIGSRLFIDGDTFRLLSVEHAVSGPIQELWKASVELIPEGGL